MKKTDTVMAIRLAAAMLAAVLVGCGSDRSEPEGSDRAAGEELFVNLCITETGEPAATRAPEDPTDAERQIYDGILCIFVGQNEATATLKAACAIDQLVTEENGATNTTSLVQRLPSEKLGLSAWPYFSADGQGGNANKLYALLLLNTSHTGLRVADGTLFNGLTSLSGTTVAGMQALELTSLGSTDRHTGLFMSNTPRQVGGSLTVMPEITSLYSSWNAAVSGTPTVIYVERAAAKVDVSADDRTSIGITLNGQPDAKARLGSLTWTPDNTTTGYYAVRNTGGWTWDAFTADGYLREGNWAKSINYGGGATLSSIAGSQPSVYEQQALAGGDVAYVMENTTGADYSTRDRLTRVIVGLQLNDGEDNPLGDCYAFNGVNTTLYTSTANLIAAMKVWWEGVKDAPDYMTRYPHLTGTDEKTAEQLFLAPAVTINSDYTVTLTLQNTAFDRSEAAELGELANELSALTIGYHEGRMYYSASIQHKATGPYSYGTLGDYGVVRSNYYRLTLGTVGTVGSPTPVLPFVVPLSLKFYIVDWKSGGSFRLSPT